MQTSVRKKDILAWPYCRPCATNVGYARIVDDTGANTGWIGYTVYSLNLWEILDHWITSSGQGCGWWAWDQVHPGKLLKFKMRNPTWARVWEGVGLLVYSDARLWRIPHCRRSGITTRRSDNIYWALPIVTERTWPLHFLEWLWGHSLKCPHILKHQYIGV